MYLLSHCKLAVNSSRAAILPTPQYCCPPNVCSPATSLQPLSLAVVARSRPTMRLATGTELIEICPLPGCFYVLSKYLTRKLSILN